METSAAAITYIGGTVNAVEKKFGQACEKLAKGFPDKVRLQRLQDGFILKTIGDAEMLPTIGVVGQDLIGSLDDFDIFLDILGYECQIERVNFDPEKARYILDAGWTGKYWKKPTEAQVKGADFVVDAIENRLPTKISVAAIIFIAAIARDSRFAVLKAVKNVFKRRG
jgi:hypothetical protein